MLNTRKNNALLKDNMEKYLIPILAGFSIVFQATLNRNSASQFGLVSAIFVNAVVFMILATIYWFAIRLQWINGSEILSAQKIDNLQWWQIIPGILGFLIVICTPMSIQFFGAAATFSIIVCTQMVLSLIWDSVQTKTVPSPISILAMSLIIIGVFILLKFKK